MSLEERLRDVIARLPIRLYQTHTLDGVELNNGVRGVERRALINMADVRKQRVLDLGCASGAECFWVLEQGATEAVGLDLAPAHIAICTRLREAYEPPPPRLAFQRCDLTRGVPAGVGEFDTVFAFALTQYIDYRPIWREVSGARVAYVEGGGDCPFGAKDLSDARWSATLIGRTPGNRAAALPDRPLFRLERR